MEIRRCTWDRGLFEWLLSCIVGWDVTKANSIRDSSDGLLASLMHGGMMSLIAKTDQDLQLRQHGNHILSVAGPLCTGVAQKVEFSEEDERLKACY